MRTVHDFTGKVAMVTGAASGIGLTAARLLASGGARVFCVDRGAERLVSLVAELGPEHRAHATDLRPVQNCRQAVAACLEAMGKIDILVNAAGVCHFRKIDAIDPEEWDEMFEVDVRSLFYTAVAAAAPMAAGGGGCILNLASNAGKKGRALSAHYAGAKAAVINMSESLALAYGKQGIRCNAVCPAVTRTPLWDGALQELQEITGKGSAEWFQTWSQATPLGRVAEPEEVGHLICFLASKEGSFISGQAINICGGFGLV